MWKCEKCSNRNPFTSYVCLNCNTPLSKEYIEVIVDEEIKFQKRKYKEFVSNNLDLFIIKRKVVNIALLLLITLTMGGYLYMNQGLYKFQNTITAIITKLNVKDKISSIELRKLNKGKEINIVKKKIAARTSLLITKKNVNEKSALIRKKIREAEEKLWGKH